jgi:chemotaxis protein MotC
VLLDWSRLLAPGGLVEEAALRREIALLAEAKDVTRLAMLTRQYVTRFPASLYAADFLRDLAGAVARLGLADDPVNYKLVANAVASLPSDDRRAFLLNLARSGIVNARFGVAASAATEALESSKTDSPEAMRARLYLAAGRLFSDGYDAALADLRTLPESKLDRSDASLLRAARRVAAQLRVVPDLNVFNTENAAALPDAEKDKPSGPALTIAQAQDALQRTSNLVSSTETGGSP